MQEAEKIWMNGSLVNWADAQIHVLSHGLHYGSSVFEGIRAYQADKGTAVFHLREHLERLARVGGLSTTCPSRTATTSSVARYMRSSAPTGYASAISGRSCSAGTDRWACSRSMPRSMSRSPRGSGAHTWR